MYFIDLLPKNFKNILINGPGFSFSNLWTTRNEHPHINEFDIIAALSMKNAMKLTSPLAPTVKNFHTTLIL